MKIQFGTVDGLVNITQENIWCFVNAIKEFMKQNGPELAKKNSIAYGTAFQRFVDPVWNDSARPFNISDINTPVYTTNGNEQSPARITFCKKMGLLEIDEKNGIFKLTPLGEAFVNKEITLQEYAFILISKMGVFSDGNYIDNVLNVIAEYFKSQPTISDSLLEDYILNKYSITKLNIEKTRFDIIVNAVEQAGLIKSIPKTNIKVLANTEYAEIFMDFQIKKSLLTPAKLDTDSDYSDYMGALDYGIFDVMTKESEPIYTKHFPNLHKYIKNIISINDTFHLQQIFYGAPGTGKSHTIKEQTKGDDTVIRTTFHPDSDYSTFVGCYKPTMSEKPKPIYGFDATGKTVKVDEERKIEYKFIQQAFTKAYIKAWKKMCDTSLWAKTATAMPPIGEDKTPYVRTGKIGVYEDFDCTPDGALTDDEKKALLEVDNFDFPFDGIDNFGELHKKIKKVIVTDEPTPEQNERYKKTITLTAEQIRELCRLYLENRNVYWFLESILSKILKKLGWSWPDLEKLKDYDGEDITIEEDESSSSLLGLYDPAEKSVYLFKNNIGNNIGLLCAVYIHEMFHAYYDSGNKYIPEIEEPIVECNTLCFLELFNKAYLDSYKISVERKQKTIVINFYGFGAHLYENRSLDWMRLYQNAYNQIDASSAIVNDYKSMFFPIYPFENEEKTRNMLYAILNPQYDEISIPKLARQFLIIEEINRGNCAQIFGDLFQLLDRGVDGYSEYPIVADEDLQKELKREFDKLNLSPLKHKIDSIFKENYPHGITDKIKSGELLVLPQNLFIWATMNTSDQSLFPIDSAFKRRWEWKYQPIIKGVDEKTGKELDWKIKIDGYQPVDWWEFIERINKVIFDLTSSEDKQLGYFFCKPESKEKTTISAKRFVEKVIFYLWNDVFKDYSYDPECCNKKDSKDEKVKYSDFYSTGGKDIVTEVLANFINQLKTKDGEESPLAILEAKE